MQEQHIIVETREDWEKRKKRKEKERVNRLHSPILFVFRNLKWIAPVLFFVSLYGIFAEPLMKNVYLFGVLFFGIITFLLWRKKRQVLKNPVS